LQSFRRTRAGAQQCNWQIKEFLRKPENYNRRQGPKNNIWEADRHFFGYLMGLAKSTVPAVGGGQGNCDHRLHEHGMF
jgi:hypothetical protein